MADSPALDIATLQDMLDSPLFAAYVHELGLRVTDTSDTLGSSLAAAKFRFSRMRLSRILNV